MEKSSKGDIRKKLTDKQKEIILTVVVLIVSILVGIFLGRYLFDLMH